MAVNILISGKMFLNISRPQGSDFARKVSISIDLYTKHIIYTKPRGPKPLNTIKLPFSSEHMNAEVIADYKSHEGEHVQILAGIESKRGERFTDGKGTIERGKVFERYALRVKVDGTVVKEYAQSITPQEGELAECLSHTREYIEVKPSGLFSGEHQPAEVDVNWEPYVKDMIDKLEEFRASADEIVAAIDTQLATLADHREREVDDPSAHYEHG